MFFFLFQYQLDWFTASMYKLIEDATTIEEPQKKVPVFELLIEYFELHDKKSKETNFRMQRSIKSNIDEVLQEIETVIGDKKNK